MNVRSRTGCLSCKKRKRRCGEEKPACRNCVVRGFECPYLLENSQSVNVRFQISVSNGARLPVEKQSRRHFLTISSGDVSLLSSEHKQEATPAKVADTRTRTVSDCAANPIRLEASIFAAPIVDCGGLEEQLFQYYLHVICRVRVFRDDPRNKFRSLVVPFCRGRRPLLYAVLSVSANDRRTETVAPHINYEQLALSYKSLALKSLRKSLSDVSNASEALMTCLILCTLEIASGCQPDWVRHVHGAFAIINSFSSMIDPEILFFARSYFQSRAIFFRTTGSHHNVSHKDPDPLANPQPDISHCMDIFSRSLNLSTSYTDERAKIQSHIGCSLSLLDIIARATDLVSQKQQLRRTGTNSFFSEGEMLQRVISLRSELDSLPKEYSPDSEYLTTCGQCFRMAADLYLQLACDISLSQPNLQTLLGKLLDHIGQVIREDQERQLFPMWPLFLAGCLSTSDDDRVRVLDYFTYLSYSWPVSNVAIVRKATEMVWKFRDLNPHDCGSGFDWQTIINRMNWKLSLS
ncbi:hypothetical protein BO78DRAFT_351608 [Aspergillus sclerotiicarbonarius CBS 121057]|uniref:Zn(2)-C6 fungal-type domain-containing protein n=1 Tax=Aspergillus sclerotiicarbonarius (strain CBS 121057 / IBT 28362) TaxID=1448318 RepID=A0A319ENT0_ASPSB|nr:hypothetical protein BO78DRAFT_351608 [Aspergillus sclerotiicarbonarius CBS 121057]